MKNISKTLTVGALAASLLGLSAPASQAAPTYDGKTSATAAASCYEIKQNDPGSKSGTYWLYTPSMDAPAQFYCDQESNGGGWVMVGKGRDGWASSYEGKGKPSDLTSSPNSFGVAQLPSRTVDALRNDQPLSGTDIRIHRAQNAQGTSWQDVIFKRGQIQGWSWAFEMENPYTDYRVISKEAGASRVTSGVGRPGMAVNDMRGMYFLGFKENGWKNGWLYSGTVHGTNDPGSYLYEQTPGSGWSTPMAQAFIQPKLMRSQLNYAGAHAYKAAANLPNSYAESQVWSAGERTNPNTSTATDPASVAFEAGKETATQVQSFAQVGNTVFTGGNFGYVTKNATGERVNQAYIAGYDVNTGELVRSFAPKLNGQVKTMVALPDGKLAIGGNFTTVNGQAAEGLAVVNPANGALDTSYKFSVKNKIAGSRTEVRTLTVAGGKLYVGGLFTHSSASNGEVWSQNGIRFNLSNKTVDKGWLPKANGGINDLSVSADGAHVYAAGFFTNIGGANANRLADLNGTTGAQNRAWGWVPSTSKAAEQYQWAVAADGNASVWAGGAQHQTHAYRAGALAQFASAMTFNGGDTQDIHLNKGVAYVTNHSGHAVYEGAKFYDRADAAKTATNIYQMNLVMAMDANTGKVIPDFNPQMKGTKGQGVWAAFTDSTGKLWVGGDIATTVTKGGYAQKSGGFARYAPRG